MDEVVCIDSEDSEDSVIEVEVPQKTPPPVIDIDEIILNVESRNQETVSAKEIIRRERVLLNMCETTTDAGEEAAQSVNSISPDHWTPDMIKFYNDDWGDEDEFIVEKIQLEMDKNPSLWEISRKDILHMHNKNKSRRMKCWNCGQHGHRVSLCPDVPIIQKCHMCGVEGHMEYSCPNSKCLSCGNPSREYVLDCYKCKHESTETCSRCHLVGHNFINCSDHWRLYHITTNSGSVVIPEKNINKSEKDMWCCNCGKRGHYQNTCNKKKDCGGFSETSPFVVSYKKAFSDNLYKVEYPKKLKMKKRRRKKNKKEAIRRIKPMKNPFNKSREAKKYLSKKINGNLI